MSEFYKFASESPFLTFFLFVVVAEMVVGVFNAIARIFKKS